MRRVDELVAALLQQCLDPAPKLELHPRPLGVPADQTGPDILLDAEQVQLLTELSVIPSPCFLEPVQMLAQGVLAEEGGAVDALEHLTPLVASPVRAGGAEELEVLDPARARHVWSAAEIQEGTVPIGGDPLILRDLGQSLELEGIIPEELLRLGTLDLTSLEGMVRGGDLGHLGLDPLQIVGGERLLDVEIVVETFVDGRTEADAGVRIQLPDRRREHVSGGMPQGVESVGVGVAARHDLDARAVLQRPAQVPQLTVDARGYRGACQPGTYRSRQIGSRGSRRQLRSRIVGKEYGDGTLAHRIPVDDPG